MLKKRIAKSVQQMHKNLAVDALHPLKRELIKRLVEAYRDLTAEFNTGE